MDRRTVQLRVGGQSYRVVTTASDGDLKRFVGVVEDRLATLTPRGKPPAPYAMLLVALALVHELEEVREQAARQEHRAREMLQRLLERIDAALESEAPGAAAPPPLPAPSS